MPYIKTELRTQLLADPSLVTEPGELNFLITHAMINDKGDESEVGTYYSKLVDYYIINKGKSYSTYNDIVGVFTCAAFEYYRRTRDYNIAQTLLELAKEFYIIDVIPYEDEKIKVNGDVYL